MAKDDVLQVQDVEVEDAHAEAAETDWKAQARKWEKRAKENSAAADELAKLKESQMTELERAQARASKAEKALKTLQEKAEHEKLKEKIAQELKVPASLISGSDEEGMRAWAKSLAEFAKPHVGATVPKNSQFAQADTKQDDRAKLAKQVFN
ncbi:hypothetical protein [Fannyhessea vaginae]|uniref:hypothetical protein n=1 Tax=Fannyhessea vaginae TaxID=82135 RepID=UPI00206A7A4C|nr:hypothetical protein [Fannyhessea vaginae]DAK30282.1 MAG TPA: protein of unknown function (DUF4355) [Caudoviricetes sp.]